MICCQATFTFTLTVNADLRIWDSFTAANYANTCYGTGNGNSPLCDRFIVPEVRSSRSLSLVIELPSFCHRTITNTPPPSNSRVADEGADAELCRSPGIRTKTHPALSQTEPVSCLLLLHMKWILANWTLIAYLGLMQRRLKE